MRRAIAFVDTLIPSLCTISFAIGSIFIGVIALLGTADVIGTTFFHVPVVGTLEITEISLVIVVFLGLGHAQYRRAHITVDILINRFRGPLRVLSEAASFGSAFLCFAIIGWLGLLEALHSLRINEMAAGAYRVPVYPGRFLLAVGAFVAALEALRCLIHVLLGSNPSHGQDGRIGDGQPGSAK